MLKINLCLVLCILCLRCGEVLPYTKVALNGINGGNDGPRIYKALNADLLFPKVFNSSENLVSTTPPTQFESVTPTVIQEVYKNHRSEFQNEADSQKMFQMSQIYVTPPSNVKEEIIPNQQAQEQFQQNYDSTEAAHYSKANNVTNQDQGQSFAAGKSEIIQESASTGRAVDYNTKYPFGQLITPLTRTKPQPTQRYKQTRPLPYQPNNYRDKYFYPTSGAYRRPPNRAELDKLRGKSKFADRFTPSEAVASAQFGKNNHHHHDHSKTKNPAASNLVQSYVQPTNLYSFPPNVNAQYPAPANDPKAKLPASSVSSYLPPPSGPLTNTAGYPLVTSNSNVNGYKYAPPEASTDNGYKYTPPESPKDEGYKYEAPMSSYLPPGSAASTDQKDNDMSGADADNGDDSIGVLPASAQDADKPNDSEPHHHHSHDHIPSDYDPNKTYPTPPPGWMEEQPDSMADHDHHDHGDHDHDHHHEHPNPDIDNHDHDDVPSFPMYDHHALIYDDHHYHHHHVEPETTTPEPPPPPPPEPAPEPRVKKYSYFYIGRKLWYIPLYFTVWFSFYVLWLIVKSIARHKVNLPNHYVARRSLPNFSKFNEDELINQMTVSVLAKIDDFQRKYAT